MKPETKQIKITFFQVRNTNSKLEKICQTALEFFEKKEPLLIKVPNPASLEFIDQLLWRYPPDSFLPHVIKDSPCDDLIVITTSNEKPNGADLIFNLTAMPIDLSKYSFNSVFEFEDLTSPQKNQTAKEHYQFYKSKGYTIISY